MGQASSRHLVVFNALFFTAQRVLGGLADEIAAQLHALSIR
ncbi:hypothetical protein OF385_16045 [Glutamicibacter sp. JL.03c]|nr:hypothetical protein [Glutamicibacter sp. JL.03c]UYQ77502.1 hypothetical protein OF385_16045 [Glutamicibacter sp. JL.03c]